MTRLVWTDQAIEDLEAIRAFTGQTFPEYGQLTIARIVEAVERLPQFPRSGRIVPEFGTETQREVIQPPYRIMYRLRAATIEIITVHHSSRLLPLDPPEAG